MSVTKEQVLRLFEGYPNFSNPVAKEVAVGIFNSNIGEFYGGNVSQSGGEAPTWKNVKNSIGEIVWTRVANGSYRGTLTDAFKGKTVQCQGAFFTSTNANTRCAIGIQKETDSTILLNGYDITNGSNNLDGKITGAYICFLLVETES